MKLLDKVSKRSADFELDNEQGRDSNQKQADVTKFLVINRKLPYFLRESKLLGLLFRNQPRKLEFSHTGYLLAALPHAWRGGPLAPAGGRVEDQVGRVARLQVGRPVPAVDELGNHPHMTSAKLLEFWSSTP